MIVSCPSCTVRFNVPDASLASGPRRVKCGRCGHVWRVALPSAPPPPPRRAAAMAAPAAAGSSTAAGATRFSAVAAAATPAPQPIAPARAERGRSTLWIWWLLLLLLIAAVAAGGWFARGWIVQNWPPAERAYDWLGVPLPRIEIVERTEEQTESGGTARLIVGGVLANHAERELPVPPLVFTLYDARGEPVNQWREPPPVSVLSPGEIVPFTSTVGISSSEGAARPRWDVMLLRDESASAPPQEIPDEAADEGMAPAEPEHEAPEQH